MSAAKNLRTCAKGHQYYKSSDCPVCPVCEKQKKPGEGILSMMSAPARRALENIGISTAHDLTEYSVKEIMTLHGIGPSAMKILKRVLQDHSLSFKK